MAALYGIQHRCRIRAVVLFVVLNARIDVLLRCWLPYKRRTRAL